MGEAVQLTKSFVAKLFDLDEAEITHIEGFKFDLARGTEGVQLNDLILERHTKKLQALATALESEDDLGKVIRGHIHVEHELEQIIFFASVNPDHLELKRQGYAAKVRLALVLGLRPDLAQPLKAAGSLRNDFAHQLDLKLNKEMAKKLIDTMPASLKRRFETVFSDVKSKLPKVVIAKMPPALKAQLEAKGHSLSELTEPLDLLKGEVRTHAEAQIDVLAFFLCVFEELAKERHRFALEKLQRIQKQGSENEARGQLGNTDS